MSRVIAFLLVIGISIPSPAHAEDIQFSFTDEQVEYRGRIDARVVERLIAESRSLSVKRLVIDSVGGGVIAAVQLAEWLLDRGMDVEVNALCASSCANYILPAGKTKTIRPGAMVIWHGGADQKNFREERRTFELLLERLQFEPLDWSESATFEVRRTIYLGLREAIASQQRLYRRIGANEDILLLGQEPTLIGNGQWTLSVETMRRFGIDGVNAPSGFGSPEYVSDWLREHGTPNPPASLSLDAAGNRVELKRAKR